jgi:hypothetical protein
MVNEKDLVRCINPSRNHVAMFPRWMCKDIAWQKATGYMPQELKVSEPFAMKPTEPKKPKQKNNAIITGTSH